MNILACAIYLASVSLSENCLNLVGADREWKVELSSFRYQALVYRSSLDENSSYWVTSISFQSKSKSADR